MRTIFAFDTATSQTSCALVRGGEVVGERHTHARAVLAAADELLNEAGLDARELDALVVGTGPGSFTSIRMGLATARGLALALGIPAAGVSTLHAFAGGEPVIDARRGEVFTSALRRRGPGRDLRSHAAVARPEELEVEGERLVGDGAVRYRELFEAHGADVPPDDDPAHAPRAHLLLAHAEAFGPASELEPLYVREPDAKPAAA